ncbi:MAG: hypothetical protein LBR40_03165 [Bacilli bacterium]|jgi:alanyl-tRNA synthetase|nr:hypothetical protein [Bacilli bacterium]
METKILYYESNDLIDFNAQVISCEKNNDYYEIILDQSAFYPEIGGMQCDQGTIDNSFIEKVIKKDNKIIHLSKQQVPLKEVECHIDKQKRFTNIQAHDAQHLLSAILELDYNLETVSHHTFNTYYDLVLEGKNLDDKIIKECENKANKLILKHARMNIEILNKEEYLNRGLPYNEKYGNEIRLTNIEYLNDNNACGCLHFDNMDKIMLIKILSYEKIRNQYRIIFTSGLKLGELLQNYYDLFATIKLPLKANEDNIVDKVNDLINKNHEQHNTINELKIKLFENDINQLLNNNNHIVYYNKDITYDELKLVANIIINSRNKEALAFLQIKNDTKYQFILTKNKDNDIDLSSIFTKLKEKYPLNGGGKGLQVNGQSEIDLSEIIKEYI